MSKAPRIALATICLNEHEWLYRLVEQHQDWPGLVSWAFVEASDRLYGVGAPGEVVSPEGLSVDGTTAFLEELEGLNPLVRYSAVGRVANKCEARTHYLRMIDEAEPDWIVVLDADEFYTREHQLRINEILSEQQKEPRSPVLFRQRHLWRPHAIGRVELLTYEVVGAYWNVPHLRMWPWYPGMVYRDDHNAPELADGTSLRARMLKDFHPLSPQCVHTGFASLLVSRRAKHAYYVARGEGRADGRHHYVQCRHAWERWRPGVRLPYGARVVDYQGPEPEVLR